MELIKHTNALQHVLMVLSQIQTITDVMPANKPVKLVYPGQIVHLVTTKQSMLLIIVSLTVQEGLPTHQTFITVLIIKVA